MRDSTLRERTLLVCVLAATFALAAGTASAHTVMTAPLPRDNSDSHKDPNGPCGVNRLESQPVTPLKPGSPLTVTWNETVNHPGCFVVDFAAAADQGWQTLATLPHNAAGTTPRPYTQVVTLPSAPCSDCSLRVRQIMLDAELAPGAACPPPNLDSGLTYYSCANLVLGDSTSTGGDTATGGSTSTGGSGTATGGGGTATGGSSTATGGGGTTQGGSAMDAARSDGSCACAIAGGAGDQPLELAAAMLGLAFAGWRRRFRKKSAAPH